MQFTVERDAFLRELSRVTGVIERKSTIPILSNVRLDAGAQHVLLRATDLEIQAETPCRAEIGAQGVTTVEGKLLHDVAKRAAGGCTLALKLETKNERLIVTAGRMRFEVPTLPAEDHPTLDLRAADGARSFLMDAGELRGLIEATRFAMSTEETRPYLHGIYFHQVNERLVCAATDGHRAGIRSVTLPAQADGLQGIILPRKLLGELMRCLPEKGEVAIEACPNRIVVTVAECRIVSKLIAGTYPDYERVFPQLRHSFVVDRKRFIEAIERVSLVAGEHNEGIRISVLTDGLRLSCRGDVRGQAVDEFDAVVDGPGGEIGINSRYLRDCLNAASGERVVISYQEGVAALPIIIRAENDEDLVHRMVIMPLRLPGIEEERKAA